MCNALRIPTGRPKDWRDIDFSEGARIPVAKRDRTLTWFRWGRPRGEVGARLWPPGGWVDLAVVKSGKWHRLNPRPVVVPCDAFRIRGGKGFWRGDNWYRPDATQAIQGALCTREGEQRVYIVTGYNEEYGTKVWPRLVGYLTHMVSWSDMSGEMFPDEME